MLRKPQNGSGESAGSSMMNVPRRNSSAIAKAKAQVKGSNALTCLTERSRLSQRRWSKGFLSVKDRGSNNSKIDQSCRAKGQEPQRNIVPRGTCAGRLKH